MRSIILFILLLVSTLSYSQLYINGDHFEMKSTVNLDVYQLNDCFQVVINGGDLTNSLGHILWFNSIGEMNKYLYKNGVKIEWESNKVEYKGVDVKDNKKT